MTEDTASVSPQLFLIVICLLIALIGLLLGYRWLQRRRHQDENKHLVVDMVDPESLDHKKR